LVISNHNSFRVLFDKVASVYFVWKVYLYFSIGNGRQPRKPALCQLYRHTFVSYSLKFRRDSGVHVRWVRCLRRWNIGSWQSRPIPGGSVTSQSATVWTTAAVERASSFGQWLKRATTSASSRLYNVSTRGVVVNFDLRERFPRPRSQQWGSLRPRARRVAVLGVGAGGGRLLPQRGSGVSPRKIFLRFLMPNSAFGAIWARK